MLTTGLRVVGEWDVRTNPTSTYTYTVRNSGEITDKTTGNTTYLRLNTNLDPGFSNPDPGPRLPAPQEWPYTLERNFRDNVWEYFRIRNHMLEVLYRR